MVTAPRITPGETDGVISLRQVSRSFKDTQVLTDISLDVQVGEMFGLIGPSGSGKTTLVRILVGLAKPSSGAVSVLGKAPTSFRPAARERLGYMPQHLALSPTLTLWENTLFAATLHGMGWRHRRRRARVLLHLLDLWDARNRLTSQCSGGMQRRLQLACALLHEPDFLVVDEPTAGLDPALRKTIWEHLQSLQMAGVTVFLTTQYLDEAEYCGRVAVLADGSLVAVGTPSELRRRVGGGALDIELDVTPAVVDALLKVPGVNDVERRSDRMVRVVTDHGAEIVPRVTAALQEIGTPATSLNPRVVSFDEVFLRLVEGK